MEKKKYIEYPNLKRFVNHSLRNPFGRGGARYQQTTPVEDITSLIGYDILQDYFAEKRTARLNNAKEYNQRRRNDERVIEKKEFLDSLDEKMYNEFFKMVEEHNKAFDDGEYLYQTSDFSDVETNFVKKLIKTVDRMND